jgi:nucleotide-binding universal stress UspA family protein
MCWRHAEQHHADSTAFDPDYGEASAREALTSIVARALGGTDRAATPELSVVNDIPARGLLASATEAELLVLGARGLSRIQELVLGSVSRQCVQHSTAPVAVVRKETELRTFGRIVVGVDGSTGSHRALDWALDEARRREARVVVVHCWTLPMSGGVYGIMPMVNVVAMEDAAHALAQNAVDAAETSGLPPVEYTIVAGRASEVLVAEAIDADLVVVGSRGVGGFHGLLLGSTSHDVIHHAPCPVVVIPPARVDEHPE